jgi:hypothetical protein
MRFDAVGTGGEALTSRGEWSIMAEEGISSAASPVNSPVGDFKWPFDLDAIYDQPFAWMGMSQADRSLGDKYSVLRRYSSPPFAGLC